MQFFFSLDGLFMFVFLNSFFLQLIESALIDARLVLQGSVHLVVDVAHC